MAGVGRQRVHSGERPVTGDGEVTPRVSCRQPAREVGALTGSCTLGCTTKGKGRAAKPVAQERRGSAIARGLKRGVDPTKGGSRVRRRTALQTRAPRAIGRSDVDGVAAAVGTHVRRPTRPSFKGLATLRTARARSRCWRRTRPRPGRKSGGRSPEALSCSVGTVKRPRRKPERRGRPRKPRRRAQRIARGEGRGRGRTSEAGIGQTDKRTGSGIGVGTPFKPDRGRGPPAAQEVFAGPTRRPGGQRGWPRRRRASPVTCGRSASPQARPSSRLGSRKVSKVATGVTRASTWQVSFVCERASVSPAGCPDFCFHPPAGAALRRFAPVWSGLCRGVVARQHPKPLSPRPCRRPTCSTFRASTPPVGCRLDGVSILNRGVIKGR